MVEIISANGNQLAVGNGMVTMTFVCNYLNQWQSEVGEVHQAIACAAEQDRMLSPSLLRLS